MGALSDYFNKLIAEAEAKAKLAAAEGGTLVGTLLGITNTTTPTDTTTATNIITNTKLTDGIRKTLAERGFLGGRPLDDLVKPEPMEGTDGEFIPDNPFEELPPAPDHIDDIPYVDPDCEDQVVFPPQEQLTEIDIADLDFTNTTEVFQALAHNARVTAQNRKTGEPIQNKSRYKRVGNAGWTISVQQQGYTRVLQAGPIIAPDAQMIEPLHTLLADDSGLMIVHISWKGNPVFLCSPRAKDWIDKMRNEINPHRSPVGNAKVEIKPLLSPDPGAITLIGCTIPIVHIDASRLESIGHSQILDLRMAGIADVDFIYEQNTNDNPELPVPAALIQQINYTISRSQNRAVGAMTPFNISFMNGAYTSYIEEIRALVGKSEQAEKVYYMGLLDTFQEDVYPIWEKIVQDNNYLKQMFYDGNIPPESTVDSITQQTFDFEKYGKFITRTTDNPITYSSRMYKKPSLIGIVDRSSPVEDTTTTTTTTTTPTRIAPTTTTTAATTTTTTD